MSTTPFYASFPTRWSDFDANAHMRHSAYNDYAAEARLRYFKAHNITIADFAKNHIGPILFEEHTYFRREIYMSENLSVNLKLLGATEDGRKWKIRHEIYNERDELSAIIEVFGAWMDTQKRKLTIPPDIFLSLFNELEKCDDFNWIS